MRICGVDPGLGATGYGIIEFAGSQLTLVTTGVIRSSAAKTLPDRLQTIHTRLCALIRETQPGLMVLEELYSHYDHPTTAIHMGHVRGAILLAASECQLAVVHYSATHVKKAVTGHGHATKTQIQRMVQVLLNAPVPHGPADATDALALAIAHAHTVRAPSVTTVTS